ncbi:hypothetical protein F5148DRAFT_1378333 [Russula earlei]|uniref:Uncharacterized protein n=1 Tax=Russula earlei TaxID=71964 RepID=A0ACC0TYP2_9AGAM|nr:hypothetical protein F5148DRAFT_1378333 [Russula earlei]
MPSSLATQLAQSASLNAALLVDRARRKPTQSYLFTGREADKHDLESIHALAWNAFVQYSRWNPAIQKYESILFSDAAKGLDRTLLPPSEAKELDGNISSFLRLLGKDLMEMPTGRILEWLVRRFRINEFNVEDVLSLFLPYHDSPHFAKMVTILHVKPDTPWGFVNAYKSAAKSLPRTALVMEMLRNVAVARAKTLDDASLVFLLPAMLEPLQESAICADAFTKDIVLSSYVLLSALSQKCTLQSSAIKVILNSMASCSSRVAPQQFANASLSVLSPQDSLDAIPGTFIQAVLELSDVDEIILHMVLWSGFEKFINPMISPLVDRAEQPAAFSILNALVSSTNLPDDVLKSITAHSISAALESKSSPARNLHRLLACLQQRHPNIVGAMSRLSIDENEDHEEAIDHLLLSLSVKTPLPEETPSTDMIIASMDVNDEVRAAAVQSILRTLRESVGPDSETLESLRSAFLARVHDPSITVLKALYSDPSALLPVLLSDTSAFVMAVSDAVRSKSSQVSRAILRTHLSFLAFHILPETSHDIVEDAFSRAIFPFLLFSKPKFRTAQAVWEIVEAARKRAPETGLAQCESLVDCVELVKGEERQFSENVTDKSVISTLSDPNVMCRVNLAVASRMAEAILVSSERDKRFESLLLRLSDTDSHARNLAYLITRALLGMVSGEIQIDLAQRTLNAMTNTTLEEMDGLMKEAETLQQLLNDTNLGTNVVLKPQSRNTLHSLQASLLCMISVLPRPSGGDVLNFTDSLQLGKATTRTTKFVRLMRSLYELTSSSSALSVIPASLLRAQFINLADDALAFLVGVWLSEEEASLRRTALSHAFAFIAAHEATGNVVDFQTVLPALLVALGDFDRGVRHQASECVQLLARLSKAKQASGVYAFDSIYERSSGQLKYLSWEDYRKYTEAIVAFQEHCVQDSKYIQAVHQQYLVHDPSDKRKFIAYKRRIAEYLLSHVTSCGLPAVKLFLVGLLERVTDWAKAEALSTTIQALTDKEREREWEQLFGPQFEEFSTLAVSALDSSVSGHLNDTSGALWPIFLDAMRFYFQPRSLTRPREALSKNLQNGLFSRLSLDRQTELCRSIIGIGAGSLEAKPYCISLLAKILCGAPLLIQLVTGLQPKLKDAPNRATKRAKVIEEDVSDLESFGSLAFLAEVLSGISLPGDRDLISCLLETLSNVSRSEGRPSAGVAYMEQLLMSCIQNASSATQSADETSFTGIRLDILVDIIRASESPQTFHQALLLIASLARVAPKSVLHNIMPVFTFIGSNVFHRDDNYSFRVVQKTIDSIIPLMVSSLKEKTTSREDLLIASKDFLRIFTDATNHVPRHRRTQFFIHLVDVLGPKEFLSIVCMLIVAKADKRLVRFQGRDPRAALALPLSLLQHYSPNIQLPVLIEILNEAQRLIIGFISPEHRKAASILLGDSHDDEQGSNLLPQVKRRAHALVIFTAAAFEVTSLSSSDTDIGGLNKLVSALLEISSTQNIPGTAADHEDLVEIAQVARLALSECIRSMHASHFVVSITNIVKEGRPNEHVSRGILTETFDVFVEKLPSVSRSTREEASSNIATIVTEIKRFLPHEDESLVNAALRALKVIGSSIVAGEEGFTLAALPPLCTGLGPRIIPFTRDIIQLGVGVLRDSLPVKQGENPSPAENALTVLRAVFDSIPTFWGTSELASVFRLYFDTIASGPTSEIASFARRVASKAPTSVLLSTYFEIWPSIQGVQPGAYIAGYFELVRRTLRVAPRPPVLEHIRPAFKVFLEGFDLRNKRADIDIPKAESTAVAAFVELVAKLNDTAFRPLFRKLFDWAFIVPESSVERKIAFCNVYAGLLDFFKSLMTPYLSFLVSPFVELLQPRPNGQEEDFFGPVQLCVVQTLTKSMNVDEGAFWRDDRLQQVVPVLVALVAHAGGEDAPWSDSDIGGSRGAVTAALVALGDVATDDTLLKRLNLDVLLHTREDDAHVRIFALQCARALWTAHGSKLVGFVSETATFIAECAEDEHDGVVSETHALKAAVEGATGESIEGVKIGQGG